MHEVLVWTCDTRYIYLSASSPLVVHLVHPAHSFLRWFFAYIVCDYLEHYILFPIFALVEFSLFLDTSKINNELSRPQSTRLKDHFQHEAVHHSAYHSGFCRSCVSPHSLHDSIRQWTIARWWNLYQDEHGRVPHDRLHRLRGRYKHSWLTRCVLLIRHGLRRYRRKSCQSNLSSRCWV